MMISLSLHILLATVGILFSPSLAQVPSDDWITVIENPPQNVTFNCSSPIQTPPNGSEPNKWMFPDLTNVDKSYNDGRRIVTNGGNTLMIIDADISDFGIYHCMMLYPGDDSDEWYLIKLGLNVKGPYFEDIWEKYKTGVIIGTSACASFLAISMLIMIVASHLWVAPPEWYKEEDKEDKGIDNTAFHTSVDPLNNQNIKYVQSSGKTDTNLHQRNKESKESDISLNQPSNESKMKNGEVKATGIDMITEL